MIWKLLGLGVIAMAMSGQNAPDVVSRHAEAAQRAQKAGDFERAIREYSALTRLVPDSAEVYSNLGIAYFFGRRRTEALSALTHALELKPDLASALIFTGILYHDLAQTKRAVELLEHAVKLSPGDPLARVWLGFSYSAESRFEEAANQFTVASKLQPENVDALYGLGNAYLELGRQQTQRLTQIAPDGARLWQLAGDLWHLRCDETKARFLYRESEQRKAGADENACYQAVTAFRRQSQEAFQRIADHAPDSYRGHQILAESLIAQRKIDEAIAEYREVLKAKPDLAGIRSAIGGLLMAEGRAREALSEFRQELRNRPDAAGLHYRIGSALVVLGDPEAAELALNRSLSLERTPLAAKKELAKLYIQQGKHAKAVPLLDQYIAMADGDASAHYLMMRAYRSLGNLPEAERHLVRFQELTDHEKRHASLDEALAFFRKREGESK